MCMLASKQQKSRSINNTCQYSTSFFNAKPSATVSMITLTDYYPRGLTQGQLTHVPRPTHSPSKRPAKKLDKSLPSTNAMGDLLLWFLNNAGWYPDPYLFWFYKKTSLRSLNIRPKLCPVHTSDSG